MKVLITGGAGFIGCNAAARALKRGDKVVIIDNLSRPGAEHNLEWLRGFGLRHFFQSDLRDATAIQQAFAEHKDADLVLHLGGQVAVTTSVTNPREDFEINALGTFNVLEAMRLEGLRSALIYSSTNKVYGGMEDVKVVQKDGRYNYADLPSGVSEERGLDFHSPYGCSKGAADQYVRDYARIYNIPSVVFRQSCIYGYRQWGMEDQGWIAWFMIASLINRPITVFGDGRQVRDVLFIDDLLNAYDAAWQNIGRAAGHIYNVGGGPQNILSLLELLDFIHRRQGHPVPHAWADWRPGDQRIYISDIRKAQAELNWQPEISCEAGMTQLYNWISENRTLFESSLT
jgi:CDP-paratose 2-epimerase